MKRTPFTLASRFDELLELSNWIRSQLGEDILSEQARELLYERCMQERLKELRSIFEAQSVPVDDILLTPEELHQQIEAARKEWKEAQSHAPQTP